MSKQLHSTAIQRVIIGFVSCFVAWLALASIAASSASAISDAEFLTQFGSYGSGAGQMMPPAGIATDPKTGHIYVGDSDNNRIDVFTAWGGFIKAFGWDVAPGAVNEEQEITIRATAGEFRLSFGAFGTSDLEHNAPASAAEGPGSVEAALNQLASVNLGGGRVSVTRGASAADYTQYIVSFEGGPLAGANVEEITGADGTVPLGGGGESSGIEIATRADGTPGGTGLESCTAASGCRKGSAGTGAGEFASLSKIAVDPNGDIYDLEHSTDFVSSRIQKFDSAGRFLLMFGGEVDKTTGANVCTAASGDECGAGNPGTKPGQFPLEAGTLSTSIGPSGSVFEGDVNRIQEFESDGSFKAELPFPGTIRQIAADPASGDIYVTVLANQTSSENVRKLSPSGELLGILEVARPGALVSNHEGVIFVADEWSISDSSALHRERVLEFQASGTPNSSCCVPGLGLQEEAISAFVVTSLGTNGAGDLYVANYGGLSQAEHNAFIRTYGPPPVKYEPPPAQSPTIVSQFATSVGASDAVIRAEINPHFFQDTTYYLEYGPGKCSEGACTAQKPVPPGSQLTSKVTNDPVTSSGVLLEGLQPATTYHFRVVAKSSGGGPVKGVGGTLVQDGEEGVFRTFPLPGSAASDCPNQGFRRGFSAALPDCRAYEMVSPVAKNNGDVLALIDITGFSTGLEQSSVNGEKLTFTSYRAFGNSEAAPYASQYIASRGGAGWSSQAYTKPRGPGFFGVARATENEFKAFSPDLCDAWMVHESDPPLTEGALEGYPNLYRSQNCLGTYEALSTVEPTVPPEKFDPEPQGYSADGSKAVFKAEGKLTSDAAGGNTNQLYQAGGGQLHLVCVLPNGTASSESCSAGTSGIPQFPNRTAGVSHAISEDGSKVYWSTEPAGFGGPGKLYLRLNTEEPQSQFDGEGHCSEPAAACTLTLSSKAARFWTASNDGARALFTPIEGVNAGRLNEFNLEEGGSTPIAGKVLGVAGAGEDLSYFYFVSEEALGTSNAEGNTATSGKPNLYLRHDDETSFIATLSRTDVAIEDGSTQPIPSDVTPIPIYHAARANRSGRQLAFISTESLTGYDNVDVGSSKPDSEVYIYDADSGRVSCVSCNPSGGRPVGKAVEAPVGGTLNTAASLPAATTELYAPRVLSESGDRLFFTSYDALTPRDTNGKADVYEWERAGARTCDESNASFSSQNNGCIDLISSGESPTDAEFVDMGTSGRDVFFTTNASLLPQDPGLIDIYDAREDGGFPQPPEPSASCEGEACQGPPSPPNDETPSSSAYSGPGDVVNKPAIKKHKKHRRKKKHAKKISKHRGPRK